MGRRRRGRRTPATADARMVCSPRRRRSPSTVRHRRPQRRPVRRCIACSGGRTRVRQRRCSRRTTQRCRCILPPGTPPQARFHHTSPSPTLCRCRRARAHSGPPGKAGHLGSAPAPTRPIEGTQRTPPSNRPAWPTGRTWPPACCPPGDRSSTPLGGGTLARCTRRTCRTSLGRAARRRRGSHCSPRRWSRTSLQPAPSSPRRWCRRGLGTCRQQGCP
mmetsp:Transcript_23195/g.68457  ORF Transcript_23195/g.68457 Transcript_23195/m.68457 type:complete len:218 (-) Transcript_23195:1198-1851(-)